MDDLPSGGLQADVRWGGEQGFAARQRVHIYSLIDDDSVTYSGIDGCSGVLMLKNGVRYPKPLEEGGLWSEKVVWKARQSDMPAHGGWQDGTLGSASMGMP